MPLNPNPAAEGYGGGGAQTPAEPAPDDAAEASEAKDRDRPCVYLSKDDLGGRTPKKGESITLKVTDTDPETGDVEAEIVSDEQESTGGMMGSEESHFDDAMPEGE